MGTDIIVGGRGVTRQAAGHPIALGLQLRPLPSTLHRSQIQKEVSWGQPVSSLCHYPSITCRPPCADNETFSSLSALFTLGTSFSSSRALTPFLFLLVTLCLYDFHIFFLSICSPVLVPFLAFLFVSFCSFDSPTPLSNSLTDAGNSGVPLSETLCWVCSWYLDCNRDILPLLLSQTDR